MITSTPVPANMPATSGMRATRCSPARVSVGTASFTGGYQSTLECPDSTWCLRRAGSGASKGGQEGGPLASAVDLERRARHIGRQRGGQEQARARHVLGGPHPAQRHGGGHGGEAGRPSVVVR